MSTNDAQPQSAATADPKHEKPRLIVVIERACLEMAKVGKDYVLLDCDNHKSFLLRHKRNPAEYRPDILHQVRAPPLLRRVRGSIGRGDPDRPLLRFAATPSLSPSAC